MIISVALQQCVARARHLICNVRWEAPSGKRLAALAETRKLERIVKSGVDVLFSNCSPGDNLINN